MKNMRTAKVTNASTTTFSVTPVKIARNGTKCTSTNGMEDRTFTRSSGARDREAGAGPGATAVDETTMGSLLGSRSKPADLPVRPAYSGVGRFPTIP
jgi:hypothetical protein